MKTLPSSRALQRDFPFSAVGPHSPPGAAPLLFSIPRKVFSSTLVELRTFGFFEAALLKQEKVLPLDCSFSSLGAIGSPAFMVARV